MEDMPPSMKDRALDRLSWLSPQAVAALGPSNAFSLCFTEDVEVDWNHDYVVTSIRGVSPLGKAFIMVNGGTDAIVGMTEDQFEALPGRGDLCTSCTLPPLEDDDFDIKPSDAARIHPYWEGLNVNPSRGYVEDGALLRPVWDYHVDPAYAHLPREEDVEYDVQVGVEDGCVSLIAPLSQRGAAMLDDLSKSLHRRGDEEPVSLIGMKFKGRFENFTWTWSKIRLQTLGI
jgi:hypothetical protein